MAEYIERETCLEKVCEACNMQFGDDAPCEPSDCFMREKLMAIPTAEVEPVTFAKFNHCRGKLVCGNCGWTFAWNEPKMPYRCPFCGARIDGGTENG